jgi:hypothetical protein
MCHHCEGWYPDCLGLIPALLFRQGFAGQGRENDGKSCVIPGLGPELMNLKQ